MLKYVVKRVLMVIPVMIGVSIIVFALMRVFSPDPAPIVLGQHATQESMEAWREANGLDEPIPKQYFTYLAGALKGDLGVSYYTKTPVAKEIGARFPATIELAVAAIIFATIFGILLGVIAAVKKNTIFDALGSFIALIGVSVPIFWLGILFIMFFSGVLHLLPSGGRIDVLLKPADVTGFYMIDALIEGNGAAFRSALVHLIQPALALGMYSMAIITRIDALPHARVAGTGLHPHGSREGHLRGQGHRQACAPQLDDPRDDGDRSAVRLSVGGALLTESVFSWPGIGKFTVDSILKSDFPVVQGIVLLVAVIFVTVNLVADLVYAYLDPRIKYSSKREG